MEQQQPLYIGELAPASYRGRMIAFNNVCVTFGQLVSYSFGAAFTDVRHGWRFLVAVGGIPPILLTCLLPFCPESPRHLIYHSNLDAGKRALAQIYPNATPEQVAARALRMQESIQGQRHILEGMSLWSKLKQLHCIRSNLYALICACTVMAGENTDFTLPHCYVLTLYPVSQLAGFNTLMYYSGTLFGLVGFKKPTLVSLVVGGTNFVFTLLNVTIIDKAGRRRILLSGVLGMVRLLTFLDTNRCIG